MRMAMRTVKNEGNKHGMDDTAMVQRWKEENGEGVDMNEYRT